MRTNDISGGETVEKTKSHIKKNSVAYINGMFSYSTGGDFLRLPLVPGTTLVV